MRYEIRESWRMSFSVSLAMADTIGPVAGRAPGSPRSLRRFSTGPAQRCAGSAQLGSSPRGSGRLALRRALRSDRGEVRARADRAIKARPALPRREILLQAIERAEPPAEVVAEVHERRLARAWDHRAAVLEAAVMAEDDVQQGLGGARVEAVDLVDETAHAVVAQRDLALQLAGVGHLDGGTAEAVVAAAAAREGVRAELADV